MTNRPAPASPASTGRTYWQSFEHLADSAEVRDIVDKEFAKYDPAVIQSLPRRSFLKYVAASMALAGVGLAGCRRWPKEAVVPNVAQPTDRIPGVSEYYATSWELAGVGSGLLAASFDGRPIKLEGNPSHPGNVVRSGNWGSADAYAQAQPLALYDPDRSRNVVVRSGNTGAPESVDWFKSTIIPRLQQASGASMAVLCEATASPSMARLRGEFEAAKPGATWYTWEPLASETVNAGQRIRPVYALHEAAVVVSLDDDYLGMHPARTRYSADWSVRRATADASDGSEPVMSRCYTVECRYSLTGASSDIRLPVRPSRLGIIAQALAAAIGISDVGEPELDDREAAFVEHAAEDLLASKGRCLVAFGQHLSPAVQSLAMRMNALLGNVGTTLTYIEDPLLAGEPLAELVRRMNANEIETLLIVGGNPVYDAPADLNFAAALRNVATSVHLSLYQDETSQIVSYHVPRAHFLEAWGDTRGWNGVVAPTQPLIMPLWGALSALELLAMVAGLEENDGMMIVRKTFEGLGVADDAAWRKVLHDGILPDSQAATVDIGEPAAVAMSEVMATSGDQFEVTFAGALTVFDGRFANSGWLQESPDPLTKLTWDNAALLSIHDAEALDVSTNDVIELTINGRMLGLPVYVMPGQPRGVIGLTLGYGRTAGGALAVFDDDDGGGFDTYRLRTSDALWFGAAASVVQQGQHYILAMTQNHHLIDDVGFKGRDDRIGDKNHTGKIFRETTFTEHKDYVLDHPPGSRKKAHGGHGDTYPGNEHQHPTVTLQMFSAPSAFNTPHAWGMTIDTNVCTGCSACVVACQSENNIPVVGKESVLNSREMSWLRIDRYFKSEGEDVDAKKRDENPDVAWQPMMCVHCENAPCEQVCPVAATVHDTEGLNTMVYNRCIGTRYCSNNCPYKVRRFNYLDWHYHDPRGGTLSATYIGLPDQQQKEGIDAVKRMVFNPEVTVRMRGVMEKCTYCTQRIKAKTIWRRNRNEEIQDGDIKTACQNACPTEAIIFGNLNDANARVTKQQKSVRAYGVLDDLNTRPRTKYLTKLRNRPVAAHSEVPAHA